MASFWDYLGLGPSWAQKAQDQTAQDISAYQSGGVPALLANTQGGQDLAGGFGGTTKLINGPIRAYHGSPYDFNKFDLSKIGTGEGAQAYGHGLYFAENPAVAETYKRSYEPNTSLAGRIGLAPAQVPTANPGKMYEVNINADPHQFLDWDKPLAQQMGVDPRLENLMRRGSPNISQVMQEAGFPGIKYMDQGSRPSFPQERADLQKYVDIRRQELSRDPNSQELQAALARSEGHLSDFDTKNRTNNYVVFNPQIIDILKKYGLAGMLGGGAALNQDQPQAPMLGM